MQRLFKRWTLVVAAVLLATLVVFPFSSTYGAEPGEVLVNSSGTIAPNQQLQPIQIFSPGPVNIRLQVSGGTPADSVSITLQGGATGSWTALSGERIWGHAQINSNSSLVLRNNSGSSLSYQLTVYARGLIPNVTADTTSWSGIARGTGINSSIQLDAPIAGLYRFTLAASTGSYQLNVDNEAILKTVLSSATLDNDDTVYYLSAGVHTFQILQDPTATLTNWSVEITPVGGQDQLPWSESGFGLGGASPFTEEWIPINVATAQPINFRIDVSGSVVSDSLQVELYNNTTLVESRTVYADELQWATSTIGSGVNRVHVVADNANSSTLSYILTVLPIPSTPYTWTGATAGQQTTDNTSEIRLTFPASGLYSFDLSAQTGTYQFILDDDYFQKTVDGSSTGPLTTYVTSGTHTLQVIQDPSMDETRWSVAISRATPVIDALPFMRTGGAIGGIDNAFSEEWIPLVINQAQSVNVRVAVTAPTSAALMLEFYNNATPVYTAPMIYDGEVFWATTEVVSGVNRIHVVADASNEDSLDYTINVFAVPTVPYSWQGVAQGDGLNSSIELDAPVNGVYDFTLVTTEGAAQISISDTTTLASVLRPENTITTTQRVSLQAGSYVVSVIQDPSAPQTVWNMNVDLTRGTSPTTVTSVLPAAITVGQTTTVRLNGTGLSNVNQIVLSDPPFTVVISDVNVINDTTLTFEFPGDAPAGVYTIQLFNQNGTSIVAIPRLVVGYSVYLPIVRKPGTANPVPTPTPTVAPTGTTTPVIPTATAGTPIVGTPTPTASTPIAGTPTPTASTPTPTASTPIAGTPTPTNTQVATPTSTNTQVATPTSTNTQVATPTSTNTQVATPTTMP